MIYNLLLLEAACYSWIDNFILLQRQQMVNVGMARVKSHVMRM